MGSCPCLLLLRALPCITVGHTAIGRDELCVLSGLLGFVKDATNGQGMAGVTLKFTSGPNEGKTVRTWLASHAAACCVLNVGLQLERTGKLRRARRETGAVSLGFGVLHRMCRR
jgi:hypothetical protein